MFSTAYRLWRAQRALQKKRPSSALKHLAKIKEERPQTYNLLRARAYLLQGPDYRPAVISALEEEVRLFPDHLEARLLLEFVSPEVTIAAAQSAQAITELAAHAGDEFARIFAAVRPKTHLSEARLRSLYKITQTIFANGLVGDFVETGVAAGGSSALMAYMIKTHSPVPRLLHSFDSFQGMPPPRVEDQHNGVSAEEAGWGTGTCAAPEESVRGLTRQLGAEDVLRTYKGFFETTVPPFASTRPVIALLHVDADWYKSTELVFDSLYDCVIDGGYIQIDDYGYWAGCRQAVEEFEQRRGIKFELTVIDDTGVWLRKPASSNAPAKANTAPVVSPISIAPAATAPKLPPSLAARPHKWVNIGCGHVFHADWINLDVAPVSPEVLSYDARGPLPFGDGDVEAIYCSHVLEHFAKAEALPFLRECRRVLAPGGIIRLVVPDLEAIARLYLRDLDRALAGDAEAAKRYEWIVLELIDQMTRTHQGGEMLAYWRQNPVPAEAYVIERMGKEVEWHLRGFRELPEAQRQELVASALADAARSRRDPAFAAAFRATGEVHQWMYDRYSLARLLTEAGFTNAAPASANASRIADFAKYALETLPDGALRKPDSLIVEAVRG